MNLTKSGIGTFVHYNVEYHFHPRYVFLRKFRDS
jgi:hypothetical protein